MKITAAVLLAASLAVPATAHADCGDPDQPACTGPVPTVDQVMAMLGALADPNIPAMGKNDIVTPPFHDDQAQKFDTMMGLLRLESIVPVNWTVTDIEPAPNNTVGATVSNPPAWHDRGGHLAYRVGVAEWALDDHPPYRGQPRRQFGSKSNSCARNLDSAS